MSNCPTKTIGGVRRKLGLLPPDGDSHADVLTLAPQALNLDSATLKHIAQAGTADKRKTFGSSWIRDQGSHGSCNGYAGALALSRARRRVGLSRVILSGDYLYSLINGGRDQGSHLSAGMATIMRQGIATETTVPNGAIYPRKYDQRKADAEAAKYRGFECYHTQNINLFFSGLALGFDGVCAVHVGNRFSDLDRNGFAGVDRGQGNHAVACDGLIWSGGELAATAYNSWGIRWGNAGRMLLRAAHLEQTIGVHDFYLIRSATDDAPPEVR